MEIKEFVIHSALNSKFKIQFERSAVKGQDGFKVEANGDCLEEVETQAEQLRTFAIAKTLPAPEVKVNG